MNRAGLGVLDLYPASIRPTRPPTPLGNAGGLSGARLWRFSGPSGEFGLRAWPVDGPGPAMLAIVHGWLARVADLGFIPVPVATLDGRSVVESDGRSWEVARWMPGVADLARPPNRPRLRAGVEGLARFHGRLSTGRRKGFSPGLVARARELEGWIGGEFAALLAALERVPADDRSDLARRWVARARPIAPKLLATIGVASARALPIQPCLRDARPDHFLFEGDRLTGLVDFGAMGADAVSGDLARLLGEWVGPDREARLEALSAFEAIRPLDPIEHAAIAAFEAANALLGAGHWARWHFLEGRIFDIPDAVARGLARGLARIDEAGL